MKPPGATACGDTDTAATTRLPRPQTFQSHGSGKDIQALQQPLQNRSGRCRLPITLPQILQFMQATAPAGPGGPVIVR